MNNTLLSEGHVLIQASHATPRSVGGGRLLRRTFLIAFVLVSSGLLTGDVGAEERAQPIKIGVLTASWGPTPTMVGLRDGLVELGYRENEQFVLGVRFTQGDSTALPAAARELIGSSADPVVVATSIAPIARQATKVATTSQ